MIRARHCNYSFFMVHNYLCTSNFYDRIYSWLKLWIQISIFHILISTYFSTLVKSKFFILRAHQKLLQTLPRA